MVAKKRMPRRALVAGIAVLVLLSVAFAALAQGAPFLSGTVTWSSGVPAQGLEMRLVRDGQAVSGTYTDNAGYFAFRDINGQPKDYSLNVVAAGGVVANLPVGDVPPGGTMSPITLK
jgi:Carboxypeptidase regulatory-like domain